MDSKYTTEFFVDSTFKIIPFEFRPYKLFIIAGLAEEENKTIINCFILLKYADEYAYDKIFNYLYENFGFKPKIIMSDYELALHSSIKNNKNFKDNIIHVKCFFHFTKMIKMHLMKTGLFKRKMNKISIEIMRNIQLLCFIKKNKIKELKDIIIDKLKEKNSLKNFITYLKDYIFKLNENSFNYEDFINYKINEKNDLMEKIYFTNNIVENLNSKIDFYLPKRKTTNVDFINSITNIMINSKFNNKEIVRKDYISRALISIIKKYNLNDNLKWISYADYKQELINILNNNVKNIDDNGIDLLYKNLNELNNSIENKNENDNSLINVSKNSNNLTVSENHKDNIITDENISINNDSQDNFSDEYDKFNVDDNNKEKSFNSINNMDIIDEDKDNNLNLSSDKDMDLLLDLFKKTNLDKDGSSGDDIEFNLPLKERLKKN